jgi:large subunit ribosomal protein L25
MDTVEIAIQRRSPGGKNIARRLRQAGMIPGIFYGPKRAAVAVSVRSEHFESRLAHLRGSALIRLVHPETQDTELHDKMVLLKEVQRHPVTGAVLHADFYEVDLTQRLVVSVPLRFVGKPVGVVAGGILQPILREIGVRCLPTEIPEFIEVDVSALGIHEAVHLEDVQLPQGLTAVGNAAQALVTVLPPTVEETKPAAAPTEAVPTEGAAAEPAAAPATPETGTTGGKKGGGEA